ncbi:hypothetical protein DI005_20040 [Prauserella sp. PE36]|uniref:hypothetical protein n=1 Tax=Prauserella sp. PE36 TaxID=1504709 RepID=UPI000DE2B8F6|nr:hypothetical protein [Prauserella sp. PE36]RBM18087.1 hypothetical protein DI005_20040 [Prauserella sp. PE36]
MTSTELDHEAVEDRTSVLEPSDESDYLEAEDTDLAEDALDLGSVGEGRLAPVLLMMLVAGLAVVVAVFSPVGLVTWLAAGVAVAFGVLTTRALRGGA